MLAFASVILLITGCAEEKKAKRTNVLIFLVDAMRADRLSCYGYERETSPFLDEFAREACLFEHAISQSSWTYPSIASLFTGFYPSVHGVTEVESQGGRYLVNPLGERFPVLADVLRAQGWDTAAFAANPWFEADSGFRRGFEHFDDRAGGTDRNGAVLVDRVQDWLDDYYSSQPETRGLFLYLHTMETHAPFILPPEAPRVFDTRDEAELIPDPIWNQIVKRGYYQLEDERRIAYYRDQYDNCVRFADDLFRRMVTELESRPEEGEWIIVFTADHGESLFENLDGVAYNHGWGLYRRELWVPLIVRIPGEETSPQRIGETVELLDLPATLVDALGIEWPTSMQGRSLLPNMVGKQTTQEDLAVSEWSKYREDTSIFFGPWHYLYYPNQGGEELYRYREDPFERENLQEQEPEVVTEGRALFEAHLEACAALRTEYQAENETSELDAEAVENLEDMGYLK